MRVFGEICLLLAFVGSGYSSFACLLSFHDRWSHLRRPGIASAILALVGITCTIAVLAWALLMKDFRFDYVAQYSSQLLPVRYSVSALWVGQAGSLLLWTWILAVLSFVFWRTAKPARRLQTAAFGLLMANVWFLVAIMVFAADPMKASISTRQDGLGLSPLLQHPSMLIHPPVIFLGYAAWAVPFALAVGALLTGELDSRWTSIARPWAVFAWTALGAGLLLGAHWAYQELGWGGYWGWDPVENGSLIPWLTGTASIHCLIAWRQRGCMKKMAVSLAILTFGLCNFATFLTRSGIFSSVHAFSQSPIGWMFLGLMSVLLLGGIILVWQRRRQLMPDHSLGGMFSRESIILGSAYLLVILATVVIAGTLYTPLSIVFVERAVMIGPAFYNNVLMPIGVLLLAATAVMPLVPWGTPPRREDRRGLLISCVAAGIGVVVGYWFGVRHPVAVSITAIALFISTATMAAVARDVWGRYRAYHPANVFAIFKRHRRAYAAYVIHLGLVCLAIGITGSSLGTTRHETELSEGDVVEWANRRIEYARLVQREEPDKLVAEAELRVAKGQQASVVILPGRHFHLLQNQWTTEVAIHSTWSDDFYTILNAGLGEGRIAITFVVNPLMRWLWLGGWIAGLGVAIGAWPQRRRVRSQASQLRTVQGRPDRKDHEQRAA